MATLTTDNVVGFMTERIQYYIDLAMSQRNQTAAGEWQLSESFAVDLVRSLQRMARQLGPREITDLRLSVGMWLHLHPEFIDFSKELEVLEKALH